MNNPTHTNLTVTSDRRIPVALLLLRLSIFIVMFLWTSISGKPPYREHFAFIAPLTEIPLEAAQPFDCTSMRLRIPKEYQRSRNTLPPRRLPIAGTAAATERIAGETANSR